MEKLNFANPELNELVEVVTFSFNFVEALKAAKDNDGVIDFKDWVLVFPLIGEAGVAVKGAEKILAAWRNASVEDRALVLNLFNERFTLENKELEVKIENALLGLTYLIDLFLALKK